MKKSQWYVLVALIAILIGGAIVSAQEAPLEQAVVEDVKVIEAPLQVSSLKQASLNGFFSDKRISEEYSDSLLSNVEKEKATRDLKNTQEITKRLDYIIKLLSK